MGIIQKQSIKSSIFIFIGFGIGAFNILVLFPKFLTPAQLGLTRAMLDISLTLSTLCTLGSVSVIYKFFPFYSHYLKDKKNDLPLITAVACLIGFTLVVVSGIVFKDVIIRKLGKSPEFADYFYTVYPFTFLMLMFAWLESFSWGLKKTVVTNFLKEAGVRIVSTILILLYAFHVVSLNGFINLFSLLYLLPVVILFLILTGTGDWTFSITGISSVTRRLKSRLISFGLFVFGAQFLNVLARTNDTILIIGLQGLPEAGVFAIASYIIAVMEIPQRSMNSISVPVLAESWRNNDMKNIEHIYKKSVANLLVIGLGLFGLIFLNVHNVSAFLGKSYAQIELIVFIMGMAKVLDLGTGINGQIIATSNYWKFDFYTNVLYTILSLPLNFFLIKAFGLYGIAYASIISMTIYNGVRCAFLYKKFGLQPYTGKSLLVILIAMAIYFIIWSVPHFQNIFLDTFIRTVLFIVLFVPAVYASNVAPDLNAIGRNMLKRIKIF
jgi:O-antigen/teichoic acid export membrane protein